MPKLSKENIVLKQKNTAMKNEISIVNWYLDVMEEGIDSKQVMQEYAMLKKTHKAMETKLTKKITKIENEKNKIKKDYE